MQPAFNLLIHPNQLQAKPCRRSAGRLAVLLRLWWAAVGRCLARGHELSGSHAQPLRVRVSIIGPPLLIPACNFLDLACLGPE